MNSLQLLKKQRHDRISLALRRRECIALIKEIIGGRRCVKHRVFTSITECTAAWDAVVSAESHLASHHCLLLEQCKLPDVSFRYVIISDHEGKDVAVACFQLLRFLPRHYDFPVMKNPLLQKVEGLLMRKGFFILACGNMLRIDAPGIFMLEAHISSQEVFDELEHFFRSFHPAPHAILIKDWKEEDAPMLKRRFAFQRWGDDLTMKLQLSPSWKNFDDYVHALKHRYAQRVRKARKKLAPVIRRELFENEIEANRSRIHRLYCEVVQRQSIRMIIVNEDYFLRMKQGYGARFRLFGYFDGETLVAFSSNFVYEHCWEMHYIGMDYGANERHWLYFNMMHDGITDALDAGKQELELGRTARNAKASLGAQPVYFRNYLRVRGMVPRWAVKNLNKVFAEHAGADWQSRNPFGLNPKSDQQDSIS